MSKPDWTTRLFCFFVPPVALFNALTLSNVSPELVKDGWRCAGFGLLFYVLAGVLLVGCSG